MQIYGQLYVDYRSASRSVVTCPQLEKSGEAGEIYGRLVTTYTHANGEYTTTLTVAYSTDDGETECPAPSTSTTFDSGFDYGAFESATEGYSEPTTRADVLAELAGSGSFGDWVSVLDWARGNAEELHADLDAVDIEIGGDTYEGATGAVSDGGGFAHLTASKSEVEVRFRLGLPLACTVFYQIGSRYMPAYTGTPEDDYTWGSEIGVAVTDSQTITVPVTEDVLKKLRLKRVVWHPWT
jgi:hypothetical protein